MRILLSIDDSSKSEFVIKFLLWTLRFIFTFLIFYAVAFGRDE